MVLAVNPPTSGPQTAALFKENAKSAVQASTTASSVGTPSASPSTVVSLNAAVRNLVKSPLMVLVVLAIGSCAAG